MSIKQFDLFLARLQVRGQSMYEEYIHQEVMTGKYKAGDPIGMTYNQWERKQIIEAVKRIEF